MSTLTDEQLYTLFRQQIEVDNNLIKRLVDERKNLNMTQAQIAELLQTDQAYISRFESRSVNPRMRTVREYAAALGLQIRHEVVRFQPNIKTSVVKMGASASWGTPTSQVAHSYLPGGTR